ncbi:MAG: RagB/SusD family nutrient uptake outer membrane protein [Chitinophagaceae bacterium]
MKRFHIISKALAVVLLLTATACKKNFSDPSKATEDKVFTTIRGLNAVTVGLQRSYTLGRASSLYNKVTADGFLTNQYIIVNRGNSAEDQLERGGGAVDGTNTIMAGLWTNSNKIIYDADNVINAAKGLNDKSYASGLIGYCSIFKVLALGDMAMFWEKIPAGIGTNVDFIARADGFAKAITIIDEALAAIAANPISATFTANMPTGIDVVNTLLALKARYALFIGDYPKALATANLVSPAIKSYFNFDATSVNPIFETATATDNVYEPIDSTLGLLTTLQPDLADKRVPFYTRISTTGGSRFRVNGFGAALLTQFPIYLPGEITLIKAECLARQASPDLVNAQNNLNSILTKAPATDPYGVGAQLPAIAGQLNQADLLTQIYRNRCIELYMSGLKLEDMRRFNRPNTEKRRNLLPYPFRERDNNPNTPADPAF